MDVSSKEKNIQNALVRLNFIQNRTLWLIVWIIFIPTVNYGQHHESLKLEKSISFNKDDGLPHNSVHSVAETSDGFIWIGTKNGLSRFDGSEFKTFSHHLLDPASIYDNRISPLLADSQNLWVGTHLGLSRLDLKTNKFKNYQFDNYQLCDTLSKKVSTRIMSLLKSQDGSIWAGSYSDGLFRFLPEQDSFRNYRYPSEEIVLNHLSPLGIDHVLSLVQDRFNDSIIWAGTTAGLLRINTITDSIAWYFYPKKEERNFASQNAILNIYHHDDSLLYIGSWHAKVNIFDPKTKNFYLLPIKNKSKNAQQEAYKLLNVPISTIKRKSKNEIWIQTVTGLITYNTDTKNWTRIQKNKLNKNIHYGIRLIDSQGRGWFPKQGGIHLFDPLQQQFIQYNFDDLNPVNHGFTYYFLDQKGKNEFGVLSRDADGIYFLNTQTDEWEEFAIDDKYHKPGSAFGPVGFSLSPSGSWTIPSLSGIFDFNRAKKTFKPFPLPAEFRQKTFLSTFWDSAGRLWIGTSRSGIIRWTPQQSKWEIFKEQLKGENGKVLNRGINNFFEDSRQNIWIRGEAGFSVYHTNRDTFFNFSGKENSFDYVYNFNEDPQGRVWVNSSLGRTGYAEVDNFEKGIVQKYDFLTSHQFKSISYLKIDAKGMLWGIYEDKLIQINPNTMEVTTHSIKYGAAEYDNIYGFDILSDGRFVIGGQNKIWVADPEKFLNNTEIPKPYLTGISVMQEPYHADTAVHLITKLDLDHAQNFFSFDFSSIGFTRGNENKFKYRLKGFDDKWTESGNRRFANFTNVPSGDYTFELKVANNEGIWNEAAFRLSVKIATPWWRTIWFWIFLILALLGLTYLIYKSRINQIRKEAKLKSDYERRLADVEMSALRAQMNPHFIFNSLNSVDYFIINNEPEVASDYLNRFSRLIRLILQNSKSTIVPLKDDLEALKLYLEMESVRFDNLFDYEVKIEKGLDLEQIFVPPMLMQPYVENAIWHGLMQKENGKGKLELGLHQNQGHLICHIEDNGIGREFAKKIKSKSASKRKSYGMKITSDRLEALNKLAGTNASVQVVDLKNEHGAATGTRVDLVIPL